MPTVQDPTDALRRKYQNQQRFDNLQWLFSGEEKTAPEAQPSQPVAPPAEPKDAEIQGWFNDFLKTTGADYADLAARGVTLGILRGDDLPWLGRMIEENRTPDERKAAWRKGVEFAGEITTLLALSLVPGLQAIPLLGLPLRGVTATGRAAVKLLPKTAGAVKTGAVRGAAEAGVISAAHGVVQQTKEELAEPEITVADLVTGEAAEKAKRQKGLGERALEVGKSTLFGVAFGAGLGGAAGALEPAASRLVNFLAERRALRPSGALAPGMGQAEIETADAAAAARKAIEEYDDAWIRYAKALDEGTIQPVQRAEVDIAAEATSAARKPIEAGPSSLERKPVAALPPAPEPKVTPPAASARDLTRQADRLEAQREGMGQRARDVLNERVIALRAESRERAAVEAAERAAGGEDVLAAAKQAVAEGRLVLPPGKALADLGPEGKINIALTAALARATFGALAGAYTGDTMEEKLERAVLGAGFGAAMSPALARRVAGKLMDGLARVLPVVRVESVKPGVAPLVAGTGARKVKLKAATEEQTAAVLQQDPNALSVTEDKVFKINFQEIEQNPERANELINKMAEIFGSGKRPYKSDAELLEAARTIEPQIVDVLLSRRPGELLNDVQSQATVNLLGALRRRVVELADRAADTGQITPEMARFLGVASTLIQRAKFASGEAGGGLRIWGLASKAMEDPALQRVVDIGELMGGPNAMQLEGGATVAQIRAMLQDIKARDPEHFGPRAWRFLLNLANGAGESWVMSAVSGATTQAVNLVGNVSKMGINLSQRAIAEQIHWGNMPGVVQGETLASIAGMMKGGADFAQLLSDSLRRNAGHAAARGALGAGYGLWAGETWEDKLQAALTYGGLAAVSAGARNMPQFKEGKWVEGMQPAVTAEKLLGPLGLKPSAWYGQAVEYLGELIRIPGDNLRLGDNLFRMMGFQGELNALNLRRAVGSWKTGGEMDALLARLNESPHAADVAAADLWASKGVFQQGLDHAFTQGIQQAITDYPVARLGVLFLKTPVNLFKEGMSLTPGINLATKEIRQNILRPGAEGDLARAKVGLSIMLAMPLLGLAYSGRLTGRHSPAERDIKEAQGIPEYSVKVGDTWIEAIQLDPVAFPAAFIADFVQYAMQVNPEERQQWADAIIMTMTAMISEKHYARNLGDFIAAMNSDRPDKWREYLERQSRLLVPSFMAQMARVNDPYRKQLHSVSDRLLARLPHFSKGVHPEYNVIGEPTPMPPGIGPDTVSQFYSHKQRDHPLLQAMLDNEVRASKLPWGVSGRDPENVAFHETGDPRDRVSLTDGERARWAQLSGKLFEQEGMRLIKSSRWPRMASGPLSERNLELTAVLRDARSEAFAQVQQESPGLVQEIEALERRREAAFYGKPTAQRPGSATLQTLGR